MSDHRESITRGCPMRRGDPEEKEEDEAREHNLQRRQGNGSPIPEIDHVHTHLQ